MFSDDDEFYDRTKKKPSIQKANESQSIETADTLLDKRDVIMKEMEDKKELFEKEKDKMASETDVETESGDALDAYMSGLSSQLGGEFLLMKKTSRCIVALIFSLFFKLFFFYLKVFALPSCCIGLSVIVLMQLL